MKTHIIIFKNLKYIKASKPAVGIIFTEGARIVGNNHPHGADETGCDRLEGTGRKVPIHSKAQTSIDPQINQSRPNQWFERDIQKIIERNHMTKKELTWWIDFFDTGSK